MTAQSKSIVIYEISKRNKLEIPIQNESVWLSLNQIVELFDTDKSGISRHIENIYSENELLRRALLQKSQQFNQRGKERF